MAVTVRKTPRVASSPTGMIRRLSSSRSSASDDQNTRAGTNARRRRSAPTAGSLTPGIRPIAIPPAARSTGYGTVAVVRETRRSNVATPPSTIKKKRKLWAVVIGASSHAGHPEPGKDELEGSDRRSGCSAQPSTRQGCQHREQREVQQLPEVSERASCEPGPDEQRRDHQAAEQVDRVAVHRRRHQRGAASRPGKMKRQT